MSYIALFLMIVVIAILISSAISSYRDDKKTWNNGICAKSDKKWCCFDMDSQGGRLYKDGEGNYCDIQWYVDR